MDKRRIRTILSFAFYPLIGIAPLLLLADKQEAMRILAEIESLPEIMVHIYGMSMYCSLGAAWWAYVLVGLVLAVISIWRFSWKIFIPAHTMFAVFFILLPILLFTEVVTYCGP